MLPVKLVRSLVLGENINYPFHHNHHLHDEDPYTHDADDEHESDDPHYHNFNHHQKPRKDSTLNNKNSKKKIPLLLFTPTKELISDTFRLAAIARDIGMDFHPTSSLSHLIFSWPSSTTTTTSSYYCYSSIPSSSSSSSSPFTPTTTTTQQQQNHRPSFSSTTTSCSSNNFCGSLPNDAVPLPFPCLSTPTASLSLLRFFVSLSKGLFKLVFFNSDPHSQVERHNPNWFYDCPPMCLFTRVSARRVGSMEDLSRELAAHGWALFRTHKPASPENSVYLFQRKDSNRVRCRGGGGVGGVGECRVREMRLPELDFGKQVPLRVLLYILLMTDDIFYLAEFS